MVFKRRFSPAALLHRGIRGPLSFGVVACHLHRLNNSQRKRKAAFATAARRRQQIVARGRGGHSQEEEGEEQKHHSASSSSSSHHHPPPAAAAGTTTTAAGDWGGWGPQHYAACDNNVAYLKQEWEKKNDDKSIEAKRDRFADLLSELDKDGWTCLHVAAFNGSLSFIETALSLLKNGKATGLEDEEDEDDKEEREDRVVNIKTEDGETAVAIANRCGHENVVDWLIDNACIDEAYGTDSDEEDDDDE